MMESYVSCGWLWLYAGGILMFLELLSPGFVIFFFGLAAASVGICRFAFGEAFGASWQVATLSVFSIFYLAVLRRWMKKLFSGTVSGTAENIDNEYVGRGGTITVAVKPPLTGRVEVGDAEWTCEAATQIPAGATVRVIAQNNLTLKVEAI